MSKKPQQTPLGKKTDQVQGQEKRPLQSLSLCRKKKKKISKQVQRSLKKELVWWVY